MFGPVVNALIIIYFYFFRKDKEGCLLNLARDNTQLLINNIWELPASRVEEAIVVELPVPFYKLPREKRLPKLKRPTKWEQFAQEKGIAKKKKPKVVWDEVLSVIEILIKKYSNIERIFILEIIISEVLLTNCL